MKKKPTSSSVKYIYYIYKSTRSYYRITAKILMVCDGMNINTRAFYQTYSSQSKPYKKPCLSKRFLPVNRIPEAFSGKSRDILRGAHSDCNFSNVKTPCIFHYFSIALCHWMLMSVKCFEDWVSSREAYFFVKLFMLNSLKKVEKINLDCIAVHCWSGNL